MTSGSHNLKSSSSYGGHSARVRMRLLVNGTSFRIAQMGPDFLFVESPSDHPPARAIIEMQVDGSQRTWEVLLPQGMKSGNERVVLAPRDATCPSADHEGVVRDTRGRVCSPGR